MLYLRFFSCVKFTNYGIFIPYHNKLRQGVKHMFAEKFDEHLEVAVIKIQNVVNIHYQEALQLGYCIAYAYFEIEGDAMILSHKFGLFEYELAALTRDKKFYQKKYDEYVENGFISYHAE